MMRTSADMVSIGQEIIQITGGLCDDDLDIAPVTMPAPMTEFEARQLAIQVGVKVHRSTGETWEHAIDRALTALGR